MAGNMEEPGTAVRVTPSRGRADEWAVVLAAADIPHWLRHRLDGWALFVSPANAAAAVETLDAYDLENASERVAGVGEVATSGSATVVGVAVALLLIGFFPVTGTRAGRSVWFEVGSADAARIMAGEWWRAVTALTLHADAPHLLGNAAADALLVTAVCRSLGPGRASVSGSAPRRRRRQRSHRRRPRPRSRVGRRVHGRLRGHRRAGGAADRDSPSRGIETVVGRHRGQPRAPGVARRRTERRSARSCLRPSRGTGSA